MPALVSGVSPGGSPSAVDITGGTDDAKDEVDGGRVDSQERTAVAMVGTTEHEAIDCTAHAHKRPPLPVHPNSAPHYTPPLTWFNDIKPH